MDSIPLAKQHGVPDRWLQWAAELPARLGGQTGPGSRRGPAAADRVRVGPAVRARSPTEQAPARLGSCGSVTGRTSAGPARIRSDLRGVGRTAQRAFAVAALQRGRAWAQRPASRCAPTGTGTGQRRASGGARRGVASSGHGLRGPARRVIQQGGDRPVSRGAAALRGQRALRGQASRQVHFSPGLCKTRCSEPQARSSGVALPSLENDRVCARLLDASVTPRETRMTVRAIR